jgi:hypothetical protein
MSALDTLSSLVRWVAWHTVRKPYKRPTKVPYGDRGYGAKADDPATWLTRAQAEKLRKARAYDGIGIELGLIENEQLAPEGARRYLAGVDLDSCFDEAGELLPWAAAILALLQSYAERSPSRGGIKIYFLIAEADVRPFLQLLGCSDKEWGCKHTITEAANGQTKPPAIEIYTAVRYFAVTFDHWADSPDEIAVIDWLTLQRLAAFFPPRITNGAGSADEGSPAPEPTEVNIAALEEKLADAPKRHPQLARRYRGTFSDMQDTSRSACDMSLGGHLKRFGFTYSEMRHVLIEWRWGAGAEHIDDDRYFERIWTRSNGKPSPPKDREGSPPGGVRRERAALRERADADDAPDPRKQAHKAVARLIFRLLREQAAQQDIETAALEEGARLGLTPSEVVRIAHYVVSRATEGEEDV